MQTQNRVSSIHRVAFLFANVAILGFGALYASSTKPPTKRVKAKAPVVDKIDYNRDIRPILAGKCFACHGADPKAIRAGLRLDDRTSATSALESGKHAIVVGSPAKSELISRINAKSDDERMPPPSTNKILTNEEKDLLKRWIAEGAEYKPHWAFVAPVRPALPAVRDAKWVRSPIDRFVLAKLERIGQKPAPEAEKSTLLRRVTLDLTGLPPTPNEVIAFVNDRSPKAYERVVDRLLSSPRFGERMAMDWVDYSRYADSNGYQADYERFQWRWRDYVIDAFNKNMPFDQFTVELLAGDMLPNATTDQIVATGFNRNHRLNTEGGVIAEEWRVENIIDRVETTSTVWLGLTSGCARCHDHKYDPISQKEFYGMFAYFNNVPESGSGEERPINHPPLVKAPMAGQADLLKALTKQVAAVDEKLSAIARANESKAADWKLDHDDNAASLAQGVVARYAMASTPSVVSGSAPQPKVVGKVGFEKGQRSGAATITEAGFVDLGSAGDFEANKPFSYAYWVYPTNGFGVPLSRMDSGANYRGWDSFLEYGKPAVHIIDSWPNNAIKVIAKTTLKEKAWNHVAVSYDGSSKASGVHMYVNGKESPVDVATNSLKGSIKTAVTTKIGRRTTGDYLNGKVDDVALYDRVLSAREVAAISGSHPAKPILAIPAEKRTAAQREALARLWSEDNDPAYAALSKERSELVAKREMTEAQIPTVMVMKEMDKPRDAFILIRGQYDKRGDKVSPMIPAALPPFPKGAPNNRLGLAKWIASPTNPLTARVTVNRFWERFFGVGIVLTSEDFGTRAEFPSHPELLDWLATEFVRTGWNVKSMMKEIVMSATYRQSSSMSEWAVKNDPANRFLSHGPRFRLPAETIRDQALAASGMLYEKVGGPSVRPYQPPGIWNETAHFGNLLNYVPDKGADGHRRSLYTFWKRTAAPPNMTLFDVPSRELCRVRRSRTNTPLQALALLNDVQYLEASRALAQRMLTQGGKTPRQRLGYAYLAVLGRNIHPDEAKVLETGLTARIAKYKSNPDAAKKLVSVGEWPHDAKAPDAELAAYIIAANTILNLDEAVTKE